MFTTQQTGVVTCIFLFICLSISQKNLTFAEN